MVQQREDTVATAEHELPLPEGVGSRIRYVRDVLRGLTQQQLADQAAELGVPITRFMVNRIEAGRRPTFGELWAICRVLEVTFGQLGVRTGDYPELRLARDDRAMQLLDSRAYRHGQGPTSRSSGSSNPSSPTSRSASPPALVPIQGGSRDGRKSRQLPTIALAH